MPPFVYSPYPNLPSRVRAGNVGPAQTRVVSDDGSADARVMPSGGALSDEEKFQLVRSVGEECITEAELRNLIEKRPDFRLYDGFEPSGRMHIAQGVFKAMNVNKCTTAGGVFVFWVADWFALMNDKMGGDLEKIKVVGKYLIEVWKSSGMNMERVVFKWAADEIINHANAYWTKALDVARSFSLARVIKCGQIMGRKDNSLTAAQILYPIMQCTDVFYLNANICQLGVDQRKVNMLAREYCDHAGIKLKPIILSHHMLYGLKAGQAKMSKSDPDSAIFMEDTAEDVRRKILASYCPSKPEASAPKPDGESMSLVVDDLKNPVLDYICHIVFAAPYASFTAAGVTYTAFSEVKAAFLGGSLNEADMKEGLIVALNKLLEPVRSHFTSDATAKDLLEKVKLYKKETAGASLVPKECKRMKFAPHGDGVPVSVVFAPIPEGPHVTFEDLTACLANLATAVRHKEKTGARPVLWLQDWSAFVFSRLGGNQKAINAVLTVLVESLTAVAPVIMAEVVVIKQSEAILTNPGEYWISVINVGRAYRLNRICDALTDPAAVPFVGAGADERAGSVVASLMHVGDVLSLDPVEVIGSSDQASLHALALEYITSLPDTAKVPKFEHVTTPRPLLRLKPDKPAVDPEQHVTMLDQDSEVKNKIKRAFCEPGNVEVCPPIAVAAQVIAINGSLEVPQKDGPTKAYESVEALTADFSSGALHPGDLKPALTAPVKAMVISVRERIKQVKELKQADAALKNYKKQQGKKKGGKK